MERMTEEQKDKKKDLLKNVAIVVESARDYLTNEDSLSKDEEQALCLIEDSLHGMRDKIK